MGVAVSGMHYTAMAALRVHPHDTAGASWSGDSPVSPLLPMLLGPVVLLLLAGVVVMFDPLLVLREGEERRPAARPDGLPAQRPAHDAAFTASAYSSARARREPYVPRR